MLKVQLVSFTLKHTLQCLLSQLKVLTEHSIRYNLIVKTPEVVFWHNYGTKKLWNQW